MPAITSKRADVIAHDRVGGNKQLRVCEVPSQSAQSPLRRMPSRNAARFECFQSWLGSVSMIGFPPPAIDGSAPQRVQPRQPSVRRCFDVPMPVQHDHPVGNSDQCNEQPQCFTASAPKQRNKCSDYVLERFHGPFLWSTSFLRGPLRDRWLRRDALLLLHLQQLPHQAS